MYVSGLIKDGKYENISFWLKFYMGKMGKQDG